jgi:hypothetical protein
MMSTMRAGRHGLTMQAESRLAQAVGELFRHPAITSADRNVVRCGSLFLDLRFASQSLSDRLLPSLLRAPEGSPELTVAIASGEHIDLSHLLPTPRDRHRSFADELQYAAWQPGRHGILSILDYRSKSAVVWLESGGVPAWVASRPLLPLIHALTVHTPWSAVHGGSVGRNGRSLLLAGKGKSGKTTATLACARAGWDYAGDDYVLVNTVTGSIEPLYATARMRPETTESFSDFLPSTAEVSDDDGELRYELRLGGHLSTDRLRGGRLAAILLPRRRGAVVPEFEPARPSDAFAALLTETTRGLLGWPELVGAKLVALIGLAPVHFVDTGATPAAIPDAFAAFLDRV